MQILSVNRPAAFTKYILSRNSERDAFARGSGYLSSIIQNNRDLPWLLLSFHPQGVVFYAQAGNSLAGRIEKNTLQKSFGSFAPQKQKRNGITFTYYPDAGNRFFGYYQHEGIWVASYSKKLLEEVAQIQRNRQSYLFPDQDRLAPFIRSERSVEPDGTIGQPRPLHLPPRFGRMAYPERMGRRRPFHEQKSSLLFW